MASDPTENGPEPVPAEPTPAGAAPAPAAVAPSELEPQQPGRRGLDNRSLLVGLCVAIAINGGGFLSLYLYNRHGSAKPRAEREVIVDVKLMRFGQKRDLSFLPHVPVAPKTSDKAKIKLTDDPDKKPVHKEPKKEERDLSKLADLVKNLRTDEDDRANKAFAEEGDPRGVRGGTAAEASGDPYIIEIVTAVVERWTVPTMLSPGELARLQASACLKIADDGRLVEFHITETSGNSLFDGSLNATLGSIRELPKPHGRFAAAARAGRLCPTFAKQ